MYVDFLKPSILIPRVVACVCGNVKPEITEDSGKLLSMILPLRLSLFLRNSSNYSDLINIEVSFVPIRVLVCEWKPPIGLSKVSPCSKLSTHFSTSSSTLTRVLVLIAVW